MTALDSLTKDGLSLGIELPLDNDLARRDVSGQGLFPDLTRHQEEAQLADRLGFQALWLQDVPMWRPRDFGDAGQIFDPIPYLGYLAASTERILLGTAGIVLPLRHPVTLAKRPPPSTLSPVGGCCSASPRATGRAVPVLRSRFRSPWRDLPRRRACHA